MSDLGHFQFWPLLTRLGEMQIVLPAALLAALSLEFFSGARRLAVWWMLLLGLAALITTASKIAFIGWGLGWARLDFTGFSGHAMFAAAAYPVLFGTLASHLSTTGQRVAIMAGFVLALLIGVSRIMVGAHTPSEVIFGLMLGGAASATALLLAHRVRTPIPPALVFVLVAWLLLTPIGAPSSDTHSVVTRLSLMVSGHKAPYTRPRKNPGNPLPSELID
jgi:membrane-associated phospholipid phosphatase